MVHGICQACRSNPASAARPVTASSTSRSASNQACACVRVVRAPRIAPGCSAGSGSTSRRGAVANSGGYIDPTDDSLINKTLTSSNLQDMYAWEDYLAPKLPMIWQPNGAYQLNEIANNLRGATPLNPSLNINPENWYFVK
jgi:hypothetical protein